MILLKRFLRFSKGRHREDGQNPNEESSRISYLLVLSSFTCMSLLYHLDSGLTTGNPQIEIEKARHVKKKFKMAAGGEVVAKYVGHKIAKTRWSPVQQGSIATADTFATGGWDDEVDVSFKIV